MKICNCGYTTSRQWNLERHMTTCNIRNYKTIKSFIKKDADEKNNSHLKINVINTLLSHKRYKLGLSKPLPNETEEQLISQCLAYQNQGISLIDTSKSIENTFAERL